MSRFGQPPSPLSSVTSFMDGPLVAHEEGVQNGDDVHVYVGVAKEGKGEKREGRMEDGLAKEERKEGRKLTQTE